MIGAPVGNRQYAVIGEGNPVQRTFPNILVPKNHGFVGAWNCPMEYRLMMRLP